MSCPSLKLPTFAAERLLIKIDLARLDPTDSLVVTRASRGRRGFVEIVTPGALQQVSRSRGLVAQLTRSASQKVLSKRIKQGDARIGPKVKQLPIHAQFQRGG